MEKNYRAYILNWTTINQVGKIKLLRSAFVIFFLLPIIAQLIEKYQIHFEIPISWLLLYYSALSISLGTLLYGIFCPEIVSKFESFEDFDKSGKGGAYLYNQLSKIMSKKKSQGNLIELLQKYTFAHLKNGAGIEDVITRTIWGGRNTDFWFVHDTLNYSKPIIRMACSLFYFTGFVLLAIVFIEKIFTVTEYLIKIQ
jgi:hypothetical protein